VNVSIIAALDQHGCIGLNNQLPWRLSADLKRFKSLTMGHHLIMGRKTYESIGRPLPGRVSIVVTRQIEYEAPGCEICDSLESAVHRARMAGESEVFVIGGAEIYTHALPYTHCMYITYIHAVYACDVFFPEFDSAEWTITENLNFTNDTDFPHPYTFLTMLRANLPAA